MRRVIEIIDETEVTEHFYLDNGSYSFRRLSAEEAARYVYLPPTSDGVDPFNGVAE